MMDPKPKIAVVTSDFPLEAEPYRGHSTYQTIRRMKDFADIRVFCPMAVYPKIASLRPRSYRYQRAKTSWSPPDVPVTYIEYSVWPIISRPWNGWTCLRALWPQLSSWQPDLVLNYWLYPDGWAAVAAAAKLKVPSVVCSLGSDLKRIPDAFTRHWTYRTLRKATFTLAKSEDLRREILAVGVAESCCRTVLNGFDKSIFHLASQDEARASLGLPLGVPVIVYVGSFLPTKGLNELVEATKRLLPAHPELRVVLVGEGPMAAQLKQEAAGGLSGRLLLPGRAASSEVARWMTASSVFCLPSYSEGCPNVVIEAMACGRPVVTTTVGGIPELVHEGCGALIPPQDATALAAALDSALTSTWDFQSIAARSSRSWEEVAADTWEVCSDLLARSSISNRGA